MNIRSILFTLSLLSGVGLLIVLRQANKYRYNAKQVIIGILQTASHPALDEVYKGFTQELTRLMPNTHFITQNGEGSLTALHSGAISLQATPEIAGFLAIATPAARTLTALELNRPIVCAAVTDLRTIGYGKQANIGGSIDSINMTKSVELIQTLVPQARTIGILFNTAESNSIYLVELMKQALKEKNMHVYDAGITSESEIMAALDIALRNVDVLWAPTDNLVASAISLISQRALQAKVPLIVSDNLLINYGPLASLGVDYYQNGAQAARILYQVLQEGKEIAHLPHAYAQDNTIFINRSTLNHLGLTVPNQPSLHLSFVA